eukprot:982458-Pyramimonas_sp.AAC.1
MDGPFTIWSDAIRFTARGHDFDPIRCRSIRQHRPGPAGAFRGDPISSRSGTTRWRSRCVPDPTRVCGST